MTLKISPETWGQIRYEYEHTDKPVGDICLDHRVSETTLRDRVRRWGWTPRHEPVPAEGPPAMMPAQCAAPLVPAVMPCDTSAPGEPAAGLIVPIEPTAPPADGPAAVPASPAEEPPPDPAVIVPRLQGAVARVLPAIEATVTKLAAGPMPPREMERAARTLTSLTRTLRELNELLSQHQPRGADDHDLPEDADAARNELARRIEAFLASRPDETAEADAGAATANE